MCVCWLFSIQNSQSVTEDTVQFVDQRRWCWHLHQLFPQCERSLSDHCLLHTDPIINSHTLLLYPFTYCSITVLRQTDRWISTNTNTHTHPMSSCVPSELEDCGVLRQDCFDSCGVRSLGGGHDTLLWHTVRSVSTLWSFECVCVCFVGVCPKKSSLINADKGAADC